ncbi:hypothetical protein PspLS_09997 [Pyricularia sp. CBS 133598]|nr:hypothetical protein PspLS_09997 [Pyricularia sp. CBS 133598]
MCRSRTRRSLGRGRRQQRFDDAGKLQHEPRRPKHSLYRVWQVKPMSCVPVCVAPALRFETESRRPRDDSHVPTMVMIVWTGACALRKMKL